jgi:hypothetical protein
MHRNNLSHQTFGIKQRLQLTKGMPFPMFMNGTCTCMGADGSSAELCPDVLFTLNISGIDDEYDFSPCDPAVDTGGDEGSECVFGYWESWRWTNDVVSGMVRLAEEEAITLLPPLPPQPPSPVCRADICGDNGDDCCAPGDEERSCKEAGYSVVPGGTSSWGACVERFTASAVYQCCNDTAIVAWMDEFNATVALYSGWNSSSGFARPFAEQEEPEQEEPELAFTTCLQDSNKQVCGVGCSRQLNCRGNLDRYNLVMLPAEGNARL